MRPNVIISAGVGSWYPKGVERLENSLKEHGWQGDVLTWKEELPPDCPPHSEAPYAFKVKAFDAAIAQGYQNILWCDSSVWAVKNPEPLFAFIQNHGYYLWDSGHWCDTWTNDKTLDAFGVSRERAHDIRMISANIMGFDVRSEVAQKFLERWRWAMKEGLFAGHWTRQPGDKEAPVCLGHRHDQSCASLIANELRMRLDAIGVNCQYYDRHNPELMSKTISLTLEGM